MDWCGTPALYQSPGISPSWPLPPTPDDSPVECDEISVLPLSPAVPQSRLIVAEIGLATTTAYYHALPLPWLADGELKNLNAESYPGLLCVASTDDSVSANALGKRPISWSAYFTQQPPAKAIQSSPNQDELVTQVEEEKDVAYGDLHVEVTAIVGRHSCSCGKSYTRPFRLRQHIEVQSGKAEHPCLVCGFIFGRLDSLRRHEEVEHKGKKIACPGCNKYFRPDYLPNHLRGSQNAQCRVIAHAIYMQSTGDMDIDIQPPADNFWVPMIAETLKQRMLPGNAGQGGSPTEKELPSPEALVKTLLNGTTSPTRPIQRKTREPCDLCGLPLGPGEQELIEHIGKHSLDFSNKAHRCEECDINFAYYSDLQMHLEAASKGHCGFAFCHGRETSKSKSSLCTGHHPQPVYAMFFDDHKRMEETLWAWENRQLRAHRATIARLLAERIEYTQSARHSIANDEVSCIALLTRLSIGSITSFHSVPAWMEYQDKIDGDDLENEFISMALLPDQADEPTEKDQNQPKPRARPESTVLGLGHNTVDFTMEWQNGQFRPVMKQGPSTQWSNDSAPSSSKNTYLDQLQAMRSQGGLKTKASGVRNRAKAATLYFLPTSRRAQELSQVQYVTTTTT